MPPNGRPVDQIVSDIRMGWPARCQTNRKADGHQDQNHNPDAHMHFECRQFERVGVWRFRQQVRTSSLGWMIQRISRRLDREMDDRLNKLDLTLQQFAIMMAVLETGGQTQTEIGNKFDTPPPLRDQPGARPSGSRRLPGAQGSSIFPPHPHYSCEP